MKLLKREDTCRKIEEKCEEKSREIPQRRKCKNCRYAHVINRPYSHWFECRLNPAYPISVRQDSIHADRNSFLEESRMIERAYKNATKKGTIDIC